MKLIHINNLIFIHINNLMPNHLEIIANVNIQQQAIFVIEGKNNENISLFLINTGGSISLICESFFDNNKYNFKDRYL